MKNEVLNRVKKLFNISRCFHYFVLSPYIIVIFNSCCIVSNKIRNIVKRITSFKLYFTEYKCILHIIYVLYYNCKRILFYMIIIISSKESCCENIISLTYNEVNICLWFLLTIIMIYYQFIYLLYKYLILNVLFSIYFQTILIFTYLFS